MRRPVHYREIEVKLRVHDAAAVRKRLKQLGAREILTRIHESNTLYDTRQSDLRRRGQLFRLRIERPLPNRGKNNKHRSSTAILTYKAPSRSSRRAGDERTAAEAKVRKQFKVREEAEVTVSGADQLPGIFRALGLRPVFRYEKVRTTYVLPNLTGLKVELDETPIGVYIELEGPVARIHRAARLLGYSPADYMTETYGSLYLAECRRRGQKPGDMVFSQKKLPRTSLFP